MTIENRGLGWFGDRGKGCGVRDEGVGVRGAVS